MTAHERYSKFVGEIGVRRLEYLYELSFCDLLLIERGYDRRSKHIWSAERWSTYHVMAALVGGNKLAEKGIHGPQDMINFPWEREYSPLSDEEIKELQEEMKNFKI